MDTRLNCHLESWKYTHPFQTTSYLIHLWLKLIGYCFIHSFNLSPSLSSSFESPTNTYFYFFTTLSLSIFLPFSPFQPFSSLLLHHTLEQVKCTWSKYYIFVTFTFTSLQFFTSLFSLHRTDHQFLSLWKNCSFDRYINQSVAILVFVSG